MMYGNTTYERKDAVFTIPKSGDVPTMQPNWYILFAVVSFYMRVAPGTGIVSSAIIQSDNLALVLGCDAPV